MENEMFNKKVFAKIDEKRLDELNTMLDTIMKDYSLNKNIKDLESKFYPINDELYNYLDDRLMKELNITDWENIPQEYLKYFFIWFNKIEVTLEDNDKTKLLLFKWDKCWNLITNHQ